MELIGALIFYLIPLVGFILIVGALMGIKRSLESIDLHMSRISRSFERYLHPQDSASASPEDFASPQ